MTTKIMVIHDNPVDPAAFERADYDAASPAVTTPQASALCSGSTEMATGGVRMVFAQSEEP